MDIKKSKEEYPAIIDFVSDIFPISKKEKNLKENNNNAFLLSYT